jgi:hypothetical protein
MTLVLSETDVAVALVFHQPARRQRPCCHPLDVARLLDDIAELNP